MANWQDQYGPFGRFVTGGAQPPAPSGSRPPAYIPGPALQPTPSRPEDRERAVAATRRDEAETANIPPPDMARRLQEAQINQAEAQATATQNEARTRRGALDGLISQVIRVGQLYNQNYRDNDGLISSVGQLLPTSISRQFDTAGRGINNPFMAAFRTPGVGTQTDADLRAFIEANEPNSWDFDSQIEEKLGNIGRRIDAQLQAMGQPAIDWAASFQAGRMVPIQARTSPDMPQQGAGGVTVSNDIGYLQGNTRPQVQASGTSATEPVFDPVHAGHAMRVANMISDMATPDQAIIDYATRNGLADPNNLERSNLPTILRDRTNPDSRVGRWIRQNPGQPFPINEEGLYFDRPRSTGAQVLGAIGQTAPGSFAIHAGDAASFGNLDLLADTTGLGSGETVNAALAGTREQHPYASLLGNLEGSMAGAYPIANLPLSATRLSSRIPSAVRPFLDDAIVGTGYGMGVTNGDFDAALLNGTLSVAGGTAGRGVTSGTGYTLTGVTNRTAQALRNAGISMTPAQILASTGGRVGQVVRGLESAATSVPVLGHAISRRHAASRGQYNNATWNEALSPIGGRIGNETGEAAADAAVRQVQGAYSSALKGRTFQPDQSITQALDDAATTGRGIPLHGEWMEQFVNGSLRPLLFQGPMTGAQVQAARQLIRDNIATFARERGGDAVVQKLRGLELGLERMIGRQHPDVMPAIRNADNAYRRIAVARDATLQATNQGGVFTPAQIGTSARQNAVRFGGRNFAASPRRPFFQSQRDAQQILPSNVPNSGTADRMFAGRALTGLGLVGAGGGLEYMDVNAGIPAGIALGAATLLNTRRGAGYAQTALMSRPDWMRSAGGRLLSDTPLSLGPITFAPPPRLIGGRAVAGTFGTMLDPIAY